MSDARKCDRCGDYFAPSVKSRTLFEYYPMGVKRTNNCGDMCPRCAAKFDKWWNKHRKETR